MSYHFKVKFILSSVFLHHRLSHINLLDPDEVALAFFVTSLYSVTLQVLSESSV